MCKAPQTQTQAADYHVNLIMLAQWLNSTFALNGAGRFDDTAATALPHIHCDVLFKHFQNIQIVI